jgi:hypothetical protein
MKTPSLLKPYLTQKNYRLLSIAVVSGLALGALLGYTVFLKYKSTALLRFPMAAADVKPFIEMTKDAVILSRFISDQNLKEEAKVMELLMLANVRGTSKWIEAIPRISKQDAKEFGLEPSKLSNGLDDVIGYKIEASHRDPQTALALVRLQTSYALQVQMKEGVEKWVRDTELTAIGRLEKFEASKLKAAYDTAEIQARLKEFKRIMQQYPDTGRVDTKTFLSLEKGGERYLPIPNQMAVAELRLVDIKEQLSREEREQKKEVLSLSLVKQISESKLRAVNSKAWLEESIMTVKNKLATLTDERERIAGLDLLNGFYELRKKYVDGLTYILEPRAAERPEQPRPLLLAAILGFLGAFVALLWIFKDLIAQLFKQDDEDTTHA